MTSLKPYLLRAVYDWIVDNHLTPYLLVDAEQNNAVLPMQFVEDGKIILNIRPQAVEALSLGNNTVEFNARFSGKSMHIIAPLSSIIAIYAKENGKGMVFNPEDEDMDDTPPEPTPPKPSRPQLRVVK